VVGVGKCPSSVPARQIAAVILATALAGTAHAGDVPELRTWCELRTPDYHLIGDPDRDALTGLVSLLYRFAPIAEPFLPGEPVARPAALKLIVFRNARDFRRLTGKRTFAGFMQPSLQTNRLLIGPIRGDLEQTTLHEYAHYLLRNRLDVSLPVWFDEGLASLLGAVTFEGGNAIVGELPVSRLRSHMTDDGVDGGEPAQLALSRTLAIGSIDELPGRKIGAFYDWSWLLAHYLYLGRPTGPDGMPEGLEAFLSTREGSLADALGISERRLLRELERHLERPPVRTLHQPQAPLPELEFRCLDGAERDLTLARAITPQAPDMARALLAPLAEAQPGNVDVLVSLARADAAADDHPTSEARTEALIEQAPAHAGVLILAADLGVRDCLFGTSEDCPERWRLAGKRYRAALKIDPERFDAVLGLGLARLYTGRSGDAVNYLRVAYMKAPWAAVTNFYLGEAFRLIGDRRARGYLENARNWADLELWRRLAEESLKLLDAPSDAR
jgi:hypothetical protein